MHLLGVGTLAFFSFFSDYEVVTHHHLINHHSFYRLNSNLSFQFFFEFF
jgi:hypothetical protein